MRGNGKAVYAVLGVVTFLLVLAGVAGPALADLSLSSPLNTSGASHVQSAILLSKKAFADGAATVVITPSDSYSLSLSAGVLAKAYDAPLLLTATSALGSDVGAELTRLKPTQVFLVGLSSSLVTSVRSAVSGLTTSQVVVLNGADHYATAALVAGAVKAKVGTVERVVIVPGDSYAAGIAASPLASAQAWPILLTPAAGPFPQASADAITSLGAGSGIIVGTSVTPAVASFTVTKRIIGTTSANDPDGRYDACVKLADYAVAQGWLSYSHVGITSGDDYPEAEVMAPYLARDDGVLLFSKSSALTGATVAALKARGVDISTLDILGLGWAVYRQVKSVNSARVAGLSATSGPVAGGNTIVVTGSSLNAVKGVRIGKVDVAPENWHVHSSTQITISSVPAGQTLTPVAAYGAGPAEVLLQNYWGWSPSTTKDLYWYTGGPSLPGDKVVQETVKYLGVPYLWGGASPTYGFDCSGLVMYVYAKFGVTLPHKSTYQASYGTAVDKEDLLPGDLVFFYTPISHVGMYVGGGLMINAPRSGDLVVIEDVYRTAYVKARRMISPYTRVQQTSSLLAYTGTWSTGSTSSASGGSYRYADSAGSSVTVSFNGIYLQWIAKKSPVYGQASVSVDGKAPETVDLYSAGTGWQQKAWDTGLLPSGTHTIKISWTGAKNASATATNIGLDAFDVIGAVVQAQSAPTPTRYQDTDTRVAYTGLWDNSTVTSASRGSFRYIDAAGSASATFNGTYLAWVAKKGPSYGIAKVTVDGSDAGTVDLYSSSTGYLQSVWNTGTLAAGKHTVTIEWTGDKNASATGSNVSLDAFDILGTPVTQEGLTRYEQTDSHFVYAGAWATFSTTGPSAGSYKRANTSGASVTVDFTGTYLSWIATAGTTLSKAYVSLDGGVARSIDLARSAVAYQQSVWATGTLAPGPHTVKIWWDPANASGKYISVDAFDLIGTLD